MFLIIFVDSTSWLSYISANTEEKKHETWTFMHQSWQQIVCQFPNLGHFWIIFAPNLKRCTAYFLFFIIFVFFTSWLTYWTGNKKNPWNDNLYQGHQNTKKSLRSAHLGMCLKTSSSGQPKPCEGIWIDDMIIEKCLRSEKSLSRWSAWVAQALELQGSIPLPLFCKKKSYPV